MSSRISLISYALALLSGALLALSFPRFGSPAVAWVALVPLLVALCGGGGLRPSALPMGAGLRLGLVTGVVGFAGTIYWTREVVQQFGGLSMPLAMAAMLLLALYMAIYTGLAAAITAHLVGRMGYAGLILAAAPWVAGEFLRGWAFGGFPWVPLGSSQVTVLPVAQVASLVGVYGLSALLVTMNALLALALCASRRARLQAVATILAIGVAVWGWGNWRLRDARLTREGTGLTIGLVQGNVAQEAKWDPRNAERILADHMSLTRQAVGMGARYVLWPESSTPFMLEEDPTGEDVHALARELAIPLLVGSDQVERVPSPRLYNSAHLIGASGRTEAVYRKMHLVPFGEFIPLKKLLYFVAPLVDSMAEFAPGTSTVLLPVSGHQTSTSICYEVIYPGLVRDAVLKGSELLTNISNDAWYGRTSAPFQHWELASLRAIEQGRYLARAANTGISGIIDPYGRVVARSELFEQQVIVGEVRLLNELTVYGKTGDLVAWAAWALTLMAVALARRQT